MNEHLLHCVRLKENKQLVTHTHAVKVFFPDQGYSEVHKHLKSSNNV